MIWGSKTTEVKYCSSHIVSREWYVLYTWLLTIDVNLNHLTEVMFVRFFHCKLFFYSPFLYKTLWNGVLVHNSSWRTRQLWSTSWVCSSYGNYLVFFHTRDLSLPPHLFIYSIIYLYPYELVDIYFILGVIIQYYFIYFFAQIVPVLTTGSHVSLMYLHHCFCLFAHLVLSSSSFSGSMVP